jgi:hypothetical protein
VRGRTRKAAKIKRRKLLFIISSPSYFLACVFSLAKHLHGATITTSLF